MKQCVKIIFIFFSLMKLKKPLSLPTIAAEPSVETPMRFSHEIHRFSGDIFTTSEISPPVAQPSRFLQIEKFAFIIAPSTKRTLAITWARPLISVLSSVAKRNLDYLLFSECRIIEITAHFRNSTQHCIVWAEYCDNTIEAFLTNHFCR